jgi:cyclic-di-AMP phosphodiesterase PgpH
VKTERTKTPEKQSPALLWRLVLGGATWGLLCLILLTYNHYPGRLALQVGEISPRDVVAFRTVKYIDPEETAQLKQEAAAKEAPIYLHISYAAAEAEGALHKTFDQLEKVPRKSLLLTSPELEKSLSGAGNNALSWYASLSPKARSKFQGQVANLLELVMKGEIRDNGGSLTAARQRAQEAAKTQFRYGAGAELAGALVANVLRPNSKIDAETTSRARQKAMLQVRGVERPIQAGESIIGKGERVTTHHLAMLRALGVISPWSGGGWLKLLSLVLFILLGVVFLGVSASQMTPNIYRDLRRLALLSLIICVTIFAFNLFLFPLPNISMFFLPAATLIIAVLLSPPLALVAAVVQSLLVGLAGGESLLTLTLPALASCLAALLCAEHIWPPSRLVRACLQLGFANLLIAGAAGTLADLPLRELSRNAGLAFGYGLTAPLLALGAIFLLEKPFDITSHVRLLELSNPREPLLNRLQTEAPGSYYSSVIVSNLAEAAALAIKADSLLARVGALYHDLGKLRRPGLFVENQYLLGTENSHSRLTPSLSALVVLSHVRDGVDIARRYGLPRALQDIISEHHGTSLCSFFYHQAKERPGPPPAEEHFRYDGRKPHSKESGIIMLADAVQAAAHSLTDPNPEQLESLVKSLIAERLKDGQLEECELTFRELKIIMESFLRNLQSLHLHKRVEYPTLMRVIGDSATTNKELPATSHQPNRSQTPRSGRHGS